MENSRKSRTGKMRSLFDRTLETGVWTGIVMSRTLLNLVPASMRERDEIPHARFDDRRHDRRLHVDRTVSCMRNGKDREEAHLINISRSGMYVEVERPCDVGEELTFNLLGTNLGPFLRVRGRVTRSAQRGMAVQFR